MLLGRNLDFQNTFLGGNDFATSTAKQLFCLTRSYNGTLFAPLFPLRLQFPQVDSKDRCRAIEVGTGLCSPSEFPSMSCKS